jgi:hypothetical protein
MEDSRTGPFIIGFNGPPRSGKDTLATAVMDLLDKEGVTTVPVHRLALAATMRNGAAATLGMNLTDRQYSEIKDKPLPLLNGGTFRQFMIDMSEDIRQGKIWSGLLESPNVRGQSELVEQGSFDSNCDRHWVSRRS